MSEYKGTPAVVARPISEIYGRLTRLDTFSDSLANLPEEARAKIGNVKFEPEAIVVDTPQIGELRLEITEREEPTRIVLEAVGSPVPARVIVDLRAIDDDTTELTPAMDVEIPMMLRPFVGPKLQQAADQFGALLTKLSEVEDNEHIKSN